MIKLTNISKKWTQFCLSDINLEVGRGEYFFVLGPTGAGKTLLLETIAGFHKPDEGNVYLDDADVTSTPPEKRGIGFVYQHSMLFPSMSVSDNITFGFRYSNISNQEKQERLDFLIRFLNIAHLLARRDPLSLSGGEQRKIALARALALRPKILLLDEPLTPLDQSTCEELRMELKRLHNELGTTTIHVTHQRETVRAMGDKLAVIGDGTIIQTGAVEDVFTAPNCDFVARFLGVKNIFYGESTPIDNQRACIRIRQSLPHEPGNPSEVEIIAITQLKGKVGLTIDPKAFVLSQTSPASPLSDRPNVLSAIVKAIADRGAACEVTVDVERRSVVANRPKEQVIAHDLHIGSRVYLSCQPESVNVFASADVS